MSPSLETKLGKIVDHLESTFRPGGLKSQLDMGAIHQFLCDSEVQNWLDELNRQGRILKGNSLGYKGY